MNRALLLAAFATPTLVSLGACGDLPAPASVPVSAPTTTPGPAAIAAVDIASLLSLGEVSEISGVAQLTTRYRDQKSAAASVDPAQVEHIDSFDSLSFDADDGARSLVLTTIDFDSEGAASDRFGLIVGEGSGMLDLPDNIGDVSAYVEANEAGIGSMVVFKKGGWVVTLHTAQGAGISPLVDLEGLTTLARMVADRL